MASESERHDYEPNTTERPRPMQAESQCAVCGGYKHDPRHR